MPPFEPFGTAHRESLVHVPGALAPRLEGLTLRIALAADAPAVYLRSQLRGDPLGDVLRLVIPPPAPLDGCLLYTSDAADD